MIFYFMGGIIAFITAFFWKPLILEFLLKQNIKKINYNKKEIPIGMGILLLFSTVVATFFLIFFTEQPMMHYIFLFGVSLIGFAGILDDIVEESRIKGLKGHFTRMVKGELTSGGIKAIIGGLTAIFVSFSFSINLIDLIVNTFIILFSINSMNLFDVRPGRALKVFYFISGVFWVIGNFSDKYLTILMIGGTLPVLKGDLREKYMLGDVGANILGYTLGFTGAISLSIRYKGIAIFLLIILHLIAEVKSISEFINKVPLLCYLDCLGRRKEQ